MEGFFITGSDTGVGKTAITIGMIHVLQEAGVKVAGMKPIASGAEQTEAGLRNDDALQILAQNNDVGISYNTVNPYVFEPAIAPHLAAERADVTIEASVIRAGFAALSVNREMVIVEGVGGWKVPLSNKMDLEGLAKELSLPVVMVVGMRLGCLNHALLTAEAITNAGLELRGWIANQIDPLMTMKQENISTLQKLISAPFIGSVPYLAEVTAETVAEHLEAVQFK